MKRASENKGTHTVSSKKASFAEQKHDFKNKKNLRFKRKKEMPLFSLIGIKN